MTKIKLFLNLSFALLFVLPLAAQQDGVQIFKNDRDQPIIHHTLEEGQTLYGISKSYNADLSGLIAQLPGSQVDNLKIGQDIVVPLDRNKLCYRSKDCPSTQKIQLYYKAQRKDNLFRVARIYFDTSVEQIKILNQMNNTVLSDGQLVRIGWLPYKDEWMSYLSPVQINAIVQAAPQEAEIREEPVTEVNSAQSAPESVLLTMNDDPANEVTTVLEGMATRNERNNENLYEYEAKSNAIPAFNPNHLPLLTRGETAYWNKNKSSKKGYYLLHKSLPVNTMIRITNPVTNQKVLAKVVGGIPDNIYAPEISLVVTTEVARALGAIDKKFYTRIEYPNVGY